jgi:putative MATE family efflux protein
MQNGLEVSPGRETAQSFRGVRDWTQGSILRNLLSLSWPVMVNNTINVTGPTVDLIWLGRLGPENLAAVGVASMVVMLANGLMMGIFTGLRSMVSRYFGAKDKEGAVHVARQAFVIAVALGIILASVGIFLDEWILSLLGVEPEVISLGSGYMRIQLIGMIAMSMRFMTDGMMQASGDTMTPMKIAIIFRLVHVAISPVLIFGWLIFPRLGIIGSAVTSVLAQSTGSALGLWILINGRSRLRLTFRGFRFDPIIIWRLISIGIPASIMGLQNQFGQLVLTTIVVPFGTMAVAAHSLCQRIDMTLSMPIMGLGVGAGVLVGQNLGARKAQSAEKSGWMAVALSEAILVVIATLILTWPIFVIRIFSSDPDLMAVADTYIRIAAVGYSVTSFTLVLQSCVSSAGDTLPPMGISLFCVWATQIPLSIFLSHTSLGVFGVRWAIVAGSAISAVAYIIYFKAGRWKRKRV